MTQLTNKSSNRALKRSEDMAPRGERSLPAPLVAGMDASTAKDSMDLDQRGLLRPGQEVRVSEHGTDAMRVKSPTRLKPGTHTDLQLLGERRILRGEIERCRITDLDPLCYEAIFVFHQSIEMPAMLKATLALCLVLFSFVTAHAQELRAPIALPGSVNASFGTVGPLEPDNVVGGATFEQGVTAWRRGPLFVVGFVDVTVRADTSGYAWNNNLPYLAGGKVMLSGAHGVVQAVVGVAGDARATAFRRPVRAAHVSYWAGWQRATSTRDFPGSVWATSGVLTATESDNWITAAHVEQGVTAWRGQKFSVVPFAASTVSVDSQSRPWNNRGFIDTGVKVSTRVGGMAVDIGAAQRVSRAWESGATAAAPVVFVNLWVGWMPRVTQ